jgi:hypothetical protein
MKLRELTMELYNAQDILDLLQGSPNLEVLTCVHHRIESGVTVATGSEHTLQALSSGACPKLKSLDLTRMKCRLPTRNLAEVLGNRSALEKLAMNLFDIDRQLSNAINHHSSTLTRLHLVKNDNHVMMVPFVVDIVGSCEQLRHLVLEGLRDEPIDSILNTDAWKAPDMLRTLRLDGVSLMLSEALVQSKSTPTPSSIEFPVEGWRPTAKTTSGSSFDTECLELLFQTIQGFHRLRTISIYGDVYERVYR